MHSRVAAAEAPRTHNRRRVTGSSGRRREGRESERQRPNMSRHDFYSAVLLLLVVMMCCGTGGAHAVGDNSGNGQQLPQWADIFVPFKTIVLAKDGTGMGVKESFLSPSLVSAGGVMAPLAEGHTVRGSPGGSGDTVENVDIVAGYVNPAWDWTTVLAEVNKDTWRAHVAVSTVSETSRVGVASRPTTIAKGLKVFLLVEIYEEAYDDATKEWTPGDSDLLLIVGEATQSKDGEWKGMINWGDPNSLLNQITPQTKSKLRDISPAGGSGVLMEDGTLVIPLVAKNEGDSSISTIIYSKDNGANWVFPGGTPPADSLNPCMTEWEGSLLMIANTPDGQAVYESADMGTTWKEALGKLPGVWVKSQTEDSWDAKLRVRALITAMIEGKNVMLYTQRGYPSKDKEANALYLWVTDNNRTLHVGPLFVDEGGSLTSANTLLYSDGALHFLLYAVFGARGRAISLARLTEELNTIRFVLSTWAQLDASFSAMSIPTAGLVGVLSNAASDDETWMDDYRCVNATVKYATKVENGFEFLEPGSGAIWPVNSRKDNGLYTFVNRDFTLVATVIIHWAPKTSTSLLGASLGDGSGKKIIGLSYSPDSKWGTVFDGKTTPQASTWEPEKEYQVALILQNGHRGFVYVDNELVGSSETIPTPEERGDVISHFYIGGDEGGSGSSMTVTNVFLYNYPLSDAELRKVKKRGDGSVRGGVSRVLLLLLLGLWGVAALY
ncbi:trans-sialidase, putative [Trypanosoma cruzi marinkellei]|uniref:Trans-sialidase, putative n=1 Tax=Trypanosoma cruzi marinkellei TaxID=85056 RepID=K2NM81_TRYCR|nr:trans-sialidase, putative [Trypanosoma cruzi marinkellei]